MALLGLFCLSVPPTETRLTVYRRLQSGAGFDGRSFAFARVCDFKAVFDSFFCYSYTKSFYNQFFALRYVKL